MSGKCTIVIDRKKDALRVPNGCVVGNGRIATVYVLTPVTKDGVKKDEFKPRKVTVGLRGDSHTEILSGLKVGEKVRPGVFKGPKRKAFDLG